MVRLKPAYSATGASMRLEILVTEARDITLSSQRTTKALIRLRGIRRPSVRPSTFSNDFSSWSLFFLYFTYSIYRWGERMIVFLFQSDKNSGYHGNLYFPLTYNGKSAIFAVSLQIFWIVFYRNVSWVVLYDSYEFCPNRWIWLVAMAT